MLQHYDYVEIHGLANTYQSGHTNPETNNIAVQLPSKTVQKSRESAEADLWLLAYENEERVHQHFKTFEYVDANKVLKFTLVAVLFERLTHKYSRSGAITDRKVRFSYPGNRLRPSGHYDPDKLFVHRANRDSIILNLAIAA